MADIFLSCASVDRDVFLLFWSRNASASEWVLWEFQTAQAAGIGYQLGCHPGESGILSAAGRHWAASVANIRHVEGSYDRHLFRRLLTNEDMTFGYGGRAPAIDKPGLGVTVNEAVLREQAASRREFLLG